MSGIEQKYADLSRNLERLLLSKHASDSQCKKIQQVIDASHRHLEQLKEEKSQLDSDLKESNRCINLAESEIFSIRHRHHWQSKQVEGIQKALHHKDDQLERTRRELKAHKMREAQRAESEKKKEKEANRIETRTKYDELNNRKYKFNRQREGIESLEKISGQKDLTKFLKDILLKTEIQKSTCFKLTPNEGFDLYQKAKFTRRSYRIMKNYFKRTLDPLPSLKSIIDIENEVAADTLFTVESKHLIKKGVEKTVITAHLNDVKDFVEKQLTNLAENNNLIFDRSAQDEFWIAVLGDKGGDEFKLCLSLGNRKSPNSCLHLVPIGVFDEDESAENIIKFLGPVIEQLNKLKELKVTVNGTEIALPVRQFVGGDMKFQSEVLGHMGAASTHCCMFCYKTGRQLVSDYKRGEDVELRTSDSYVTDSLKKNKEMRKSVKKESSFLFKLIEMGNVIPASLHIIMGLSQRYGFDYLIEMAKKIDNGSTLQIDKKSIKSERKEKGAILELETKVETYSLFLESMKTVRTIIENFRKKSINGNSSRKACQAEFCFYRDKEMVKANAYTPKKLQCDECLKLVHAVCAGIWDEVAWELTDDSDEVFQCFKCSGTKLIQQEKIANKLIIDLKKHLDLSEEELRKRHENLEKFRAAKGGRGEKIRQLEECWRKIGADMSVWQKNFCGNHVLKLLSQPAVIEYTKIFEDHPNIEYIRNFLLALGNLQRLCVPRALEDVEIEKMEEYINRIWSNLQKFASDDSVTPKLHVLLEHVLPFVYRHKTWAKTSEQGIEAQHARYNGLKMRFRTIRNKSLRAKFCFRSLLLSNQTANRD